jgi:1-acyl-sn-glycerol-3-phosphate acyltransferase
MDIKFDKIRPFYDHEVSAAIQSIIEEPMFKGIMNFTFPNKSEVEWKAELEKIDSSAEFQTKVVYQSLMQVLQISSEGLSTSGFDKLAPDTAYLFISNHRDIILDTSLINVALVEHGLMLTASAIGDNLVKKPFLYTLSKINRNFLVQRDLTPRELLEASILLSEYIRELLTVENRSVWIAQREGRTKDGNDATHSGVLKMLTLAANKESPASFFRKVKIVPISISYEYDPTDMLKLPELMANLNNETYVKAENEDFNTLYKGIMGQKKRIHIHAGNVLAEEFNAIEVETNSNKQIKLLTQVIDNQIIGNYKLWPTNYIAFDLLYQTNQYENQYSAEEKEKFVQRLNTKIDPSNKVLLHQLLGMYANPVVNFNALNTIG